MAELGPQVYSAIIKNIIVGKTGNVFIIDKEGTVIANIRPQLVESRTNFIEQAKTKPTYKSTASKDQVTLGVNQISAVVQTNSATSEELSGQAQILKSTLSFYTLRNAQSQASDSSDEIKVLQENSNQDVTKY